MFRVDHDDIRIGDVFNDNRFEDTIYKTVCFIDRSQCIVLDENGEPFSTFRTFYRCNTTTDPQKITTKLESKMNDNLKNTFPPIDNCVLRKNRSPFVGAIMNTRDKSTKYVRVSGICAVAMYSDESDKHSNNNNSILELTFDKDVTNVIYSLNGRWCVRRVQADEAVSRWVYEHNGPRQYTTLQVIRNDKSMSLLIHFGTIDEYGSLIVE